MEGLLHLGLVQYAVCGSYHLGGELVAVAWLYVADVRIRLAGPTLFELDGLYRPRKVVPTGDTLVGVVVDAAICRRLHAVSIGADSL